ncbi:hypothetical protein DFA_04450 [Cavenderia fasciculata]|uniref:Uncharacterized protein n=1 Tax=Cavenderia fasciculata TaxID=261658 RepID=F4PPL9_CACFS|nr:uncharacterized protein DFA_04450 [Cavenderia fasciculata]EGG22332.1 hypothetical protein DFA_04450 [Cavenderia fasciculata]|eukprot:XP_004360183.1 hypothetical protein DFA_04450 [Cavenderia fasciculata]
MQEIKDYLISSLFSVFSISESCYHDGEKGSIIQFKSKLRLNLVSKQWFEWVSEWVSSKCTMSSSVYRPTTWLPPLLECLLHTGQGKRYMDGLKVAPPITVWKTIKHMILDETSDLVETMNRYRSYSQLFRATQSFIKSVDILEVYDLSSTEKLMTNYDMIKLLRERAETGKQPIRLLNITKIERMATLLSHPEISPLFQPHSIVFPSENDKWEDLLFIMSGSTVSKITFDAYFRFSESLIQNVISLSTLKHSPFASVTRLEFVDLCFMTREIISWLTPSIFPSLQSLFIINYTSKRINPIVGQINQFPNPLVSFEIENLPFGCDDLQDIRVKKLILGSYHHLDFSNNSIIDTLVLHYNPSKQSYEWHFIFPRNLKWLDMIDSRDYCNCVELNRLMTINHDGDQDLTIQINKSAKTSQRLKHEDFDWIQHRQGIRELSFLDDGLDEKATIIILNQLYLRHLNNIKPIELISGINIVDSQITPILSTIYHASRHTLQEIESTCTVTGFFS